MGPHVIRRCCAALTALVGLMNVTSALYPALPRRVELLRDFVPLHIMRVSQTATVLAGFFLILLADGLRKQRRRAMVVTVVLLAASAILNLTKGLDFEEAIAAMWVAGGLVLAREEFRVKSGFPVGRTSFQPAISFALLYLAYLYGGFLVLRHVIHPTPSVGGILVEPIRLLFGVSPYNYVGPQAQWFERSVTCIGSIGILFAILSLLRPLLPKREADASELERVRRLVARYGTDTLSYFALQDGRRYFWDESGEAALSYRIQGSVALVAGDPIGRRDRLEPLIESFIEFSESYGLEPCFLGVTADHVPLYNKTGMNVLKIGEEALLDLRTFDTTGLKRKVRRAVRHIEEMGISIERYAASDIPEQVRARMMEIWHEWLDSKGGSQRGFSMTLGRLPRASDEGCSVIVASRGDELLGYISLVPSMSGRGWSLDAMRRQPETPNGLMEACIVRAAELYRDEGYESMSLNFATLANTTNEIESRTLEATRRFLYENLSGLYQLKSLYQFNSKFEPRWQSRYVAFRAARRMPKLAFAIVQSEDPIRIPILTSRFGR